MGGISGDVIRDEAQLITAAKGGDGDAFTALVEWHYEVVHRMLLNMTRDAELAADLTQETFLTAQVHLAQLSVAASFTAWLHQIARNLFRMELRHQRKYQFLSLDWPVYAREMDVAQGGWPDICDVVSDLDEFQQAFATLALRSRQALILHNMRGIPIDDVAEMLGSTPLATRRRIARAKGVFHRQIIIDGAAGT